MQRWNPIALTAVCVFAFAARAAAIFYLGGPKLVYADEYRYWEIGQSLTSGKGFELDGRPTAMEAPIYPAFVGIGSAIWHSPISAKLAQALVSVLGCLLIFRAVKRLTGHITISLLAALTYAVYPPQLYLSAVLYPQALSTIWVLALAALVLDRYESGLESSNALLFGGFAAVGALIVPLNILLSVPTGLAITKSWRSRVKALLGLVLFLAPWATRNLIEMGKPIPLTTVGWMNLWAGNCEYATQSSGSAPIYSTEEGRRVIEKDELTQDSEFRQLALNWITKHPARAACLWVLKFTNFWRPAPAPLTESAASGTSSKQLYALCWLPTLLLGMLGLGAGRKHAALMSLFMSIILFASGYAVFFTRVRFRAPIEPLFIVAGFYLISRILPSVKSPRMA